MTCDYCSATIRPSRREDLPLASDGSAWGVAPCKACGIDYYITSRDMQRHLEYKRREQERKLTR